MQDSGKHKNQRVLNYCRSKILAEKYNFDLLFVYTDRQSMAESETLLPFGELICF